MVRRFVIACLTFVLALQSAIAQDSNELLRRVPDSFPMCLIVRDLRGQTERWRNEPWVEKLVQNKLVQAVLASPEFRDVARIEGDLKKFLDLDWAGVRDNLCGDAVVFAFQPAGASKERGLFLLKARDGELLTRVIDKINRLQKDAGELKSLDALKHQGRDYFRRVHIRETHYYFQQDSVFAISTDEDALRAVMDRKADSASTPATHLKRAGAENSVISVWFNPRALDGELRKNAADKSGPEAALLKHILAAWNDLDGAVLSLNGDKEIELRIALLARPGAEKRDWFAADRAVSPLWRNFPDDALLSIVGQVDFVKLAAWILELVPGKDRIAFEEALRKNIGAATGIDLFDQILPNLGPDVGLSIQPGEKAGDVPQAIFALAVKSLPKETPVDQKLYTTIQFFSGLALFDHNRKNPDRILWQTAKQGPVEVKHLAQDKLFPAGFQPSLALKDGYLLLATSPSAIARFRPQATAMVSPGETPLVKVNLVEIAKVLRDRRDLLIEQMVKKGKDTPTTAAQSLDGIASGLEIFESLHLVHRGGDDHASLILRLTPRK